MQQPSPDTSSGRNPDANTWRDAAPAPDIAQRLIQVNSKISPAEDSFRLELVSRPLLRVVQYITGMESSFVTTIDWDAQTQDVLYSLNTGEMQVPEGNRTDWGDSMCRSMFLAGVAHSSDIGTQIPIPAGAAALEMKSFFAVPILVGDNPIGTVCGASRSRIALSDAQMEAMQGVAPAK